MRAISVLLPAFGYPTRPTLATSFRRRWSVRISPACPGAARRAIRGRRKSGVPAAAASAARDECAVADSGQVRDRQQLAVAVLVDDRARRHLEDEVLAVSALAVRALAVAAALAFEFGME